MISSMTGFGRAERLFNGGKIIVEIKSVNHRYLDFSVRIPASLTACELEVRKIASETFTRGKLDLFARIEIDKEGNGNSSLCLNLAALRNYYAMLRQIQEELGLPGEITLADMTAFKDIFIPQETPGNQEDLQFIFMKAVADAISAAQDMKLKEGENLCRTMESSLNLITAGLVTVAARAPSVLEEYRTRLADRINRLTNGVALDEGRLAQETALLAEKSDITEEVDRMKSHLIQFRELMQTPGGVGRQMDFLVQEMGRESNTMGAKSSDLETTRIVIALKGEIAKLREQVQNIE